MMPGDAVLREDLRAYLDGLMDAASFRDYCPNGLQVEGCERVQRVVCGVTASQALIEAAIERGADTLLVHHGWFWKAEDGRVTGFRRQRMARLLAHDINLFAFHLPLDAHATLGNNAQLAARLGWTVSGRFGEQDIGFIGVPPAPTLAGELARQIERALGRAPLLIGDPGRKVARIAWCSGGAQGYFEAALAAAADVFISGEISEQTVHLARETGMAYIAAGHHATERYGVMALGAHLAEKFGIDCEFVDIDNPV
ncbi:Nif3-like dinuclear metal center hexameric protein [Sulfuritalea sp.]|uniref:Nif3-like dinuclear metal center hexameric protein n=1 Tax=Sulfuritalea sp. TaxID=2480090 RepID=UPI00286E1920|nr:Nif3-like dinuclear metal center hexameric protein [Sulfuritalea sp.]